MRKPGFSSVEPPSRATSCNPLFLRGRTPCAIFCIVLRREPVERNVTVTIVQSALGTGSRPSLIINVAMTLDGKTDTFARHSAAISSAEDMARVDQLRTECDAIMVGG